MIVGTLYNYLKLGERRIDRFHTLEKIWKIWRLKPRRQDRNLPTQVQEILQSAQTDECFCRRECQQLHKPYKNELIQKPVNPQRVPET